MTRLQELEAVAEAARKYVESEGGNQPWHDLCLAVEALPADPEPARGEVVEMELWRHTAGAAVLVIPGSAVSKELAEARHRTRLGTTRLPLVKRDGA